MVGKRVGGGEERGVIYIYIYIYIYMLATDTKENGNEVES